MKMKHNTYLFPLQQEFNAFLLAKGYSSKTINQYIADMKRFCSWLNGENLELEHVRYSDVLQYIQHKKGTIKQRTVSVMINSIKHYYNCLNLSGFAYENPTRQIDIKGIKRNKLYTILSKPELEQLYHDYPVPADEKSCLNPNSRINPFLTRKRNKIILGLMVYQGLNTQELGRLTQKDIKLRAGEIYIAESRRSNDRTLKLEAHQVLNMMEYNLHIRPRLLASHATETDLFLLNSQGGNRFHLVMHQLMKQLKVQYPNLENARQIRTSVITDWLKHYNLREVQHMVGHRYVSSTEAYLVNDLEGLHEDIKLFHPTGSSTALL